MRTEPMAHQITGERLLLDAPTYYALGCEQGTGKTWMILNDAEHQFKAGKINALFVLAPKGVHMNWVLREIPAHLSVPHVAQYWLSGAGKRHASALNRLFSVTDELAILTMNIDAINTKPGLDFARRFLNTFRAMMVIDESQRIKNPSALRTKRALLLGELAVSRRIASGTLVTNSPLELFSQFGFLRTGLLGTTSYRAFVAEYSELLPAGNPLLTAISSNSRRGTPQIVKRDAEGRPLYKNLDKLQRIIAPHTYRVLKDDCLDLPVKVYQTQYFELTTAQKRVYQTILHDRRYYRDDGDIDIFTALTLITKLRQVTSGFIMVDGEPTELKEAQPRISAMKELVEDAPGQIIIWATYREELRQIAEALHDYETVQYHGGITPKERDHAVDSFQAGDAQIFIANPASGGVGLTLHAASTVIYHSCSYSLEERLQSEDRAHRIGTRHPVVYIDLVARGTIDEDIAQALQTKAEIATKLLTFPQ